ncbi:MAG: CDP-alcohol phosphatidyltransferase family protein, partial [Anaerolineales bacterium]
MDLIWELTSTVANWISLSRLVMMVPLWIWVLQGRYEWVGWGLVYTGISDILDGLAARIFHQCSEIGEKIDSWTDHLVLISSALWAMFCRGALFPPGRLYWAMPPAALYLVNLVIGLVKYHRFAAAHLLEGKFLPVFAYFVIVLAMFGRYYDWLYIALIFSFYLSG